MTRFTLILATVLMTGCATFEQLPNRTADALQGGLPEKAMIDARQHYSNIRDNCGQVALLAQTMLAKAGIKSNYIVINVNEPLSHAILCTENGICLDNGYLSTTLFSRSELDHYEIIYPVALRNRT